MSLPELVVRTLRPDEWRLHRDVRLAALRSDPEAFCTSITDTEHLGEADWRRRNDDCSWFAFLDDRPVGMVRVWQDPEDKPVPEVISMWVDPDVRGAGVGRALMQAALEHCAGRAGRAELWVIESNVAARRLYESLGFALTGERDVAPGGRNEVQMSWSAAPSDLRD